MTMTINDLCIFYFAVLLKHLKQCKTNKCKMYFVMTLRTVYYVLTFNFNYICSLRLFQFLFICHCDCQADLSMMIDSTVNTQQVPTTHSMSFIKICFSNFSMLHR